MFHCPQVESDSGSEQKGRVRFEMCDNAISVHGSFRLHVASSLPLTFRLRVSWRVLRAQRRTCWPTGRGCLWRRWHRHPKARWSTGLRSAVKRLRSCRGGDRQQGAELRLHPIDTERRTQTERKAHRHAAGHRAVVRASTPTPTLSSGPAGEDATALETAPQRRARGC